MGENVIYSNVAIELLEIFKYLDKEISVKIPQKLKETLEKIKNTNYKFEIDKTKVLNEQELLPETRKIFTIIFLKYCCSEQERSDLINYSNDQKLLREEEKRKKYNYDNLFKDTKIEEDSKIEKKYLVEIEDIPWYKKIFNNISNFITRIFRK